MELFEYSILTMLRLTTARIEANIDLTIDWAQTNSDFG